MNISDYENYHEIKDHYNNSFSYNTYPCSIPYDFPAVPIHWHNEMELIYIKKGIAVITIDMKDYTLQSGSIAVILPGHIHGIQKEITCPSIEYENIIFDLKMLYPKHGDNLTKEFFNNLINNAFECPCCITSNTPYYNTILSCLDEADDICCEFPKGYNLAIRSCLYRFFYTLNKIISKNTLPSHHFYTKSNSDYIDRIKLITKYIEQHYNEDISIKKMADICGISQSHFMKFFKENIGTSFIDYLNDYRLITATRLLNSNSSITEISILCGFNNISYFNRLFKKKYSMSPRQFKKTLLNNDF